MEQEVFRVNDFCQRYAISRTALYREIWVNRLNIIKCGKRTLITREDAEKWLRNLEMNTARPPVKLR
jgi:hypothetical protein